MDELFEMMTDFRNNFFAVLQGNETVEYGKEAGGNTTNAFLPLEERCDNQISKRLLGQTGTTENGAWEGTAEVHERVENRGTNMIKCCSSFISITLSFPNW